MYRTDATPTLTCFGLQDMAGRTPLSIALRKEKFNQAGIVALLETASSELLCPCRILEITALASTADPYPDLSHTPANEDKREYSNPYMDSDSD